MELQGHWPSVRVGPIWSDAVAEHPMCFRESDAHVKQLGRSDQPGPAPTLFMPHIIIEYSDNLEGPLPIQGMVDRVHQTALDHGLPALDALRTRAAGREHFRIADGDPTNALIALTARIGPGRDSATKSSFLEALMAALEETIEPISSEFAVALSAEIQEIDPQLRINHNHVRTRLQQDKT